MDIDTNLFRLALLENGEPVEFYVERKQTESLVGNVYAGRVETVVPNLQAAFVDIGTGKNGYLYYGNARAASGAEKENRPKAGDTLVVQVEKDAVGTKGAVLTRNISFAGKFLALLPNEGGADNDLGAAVHGSLHGVVTVIIGSLIAVGGLIVLVAQAVVGSIELHAVEGALVEGLILQLANVGDESDFILAVLGRHVVVDIVRIGVSGGPALLIVSVVGILVVVGLLITTGNEGQNHDESEKQRKKLLHSSILPYFSGRRRAALRFILKCGRTSSNSIAKAKGRIKSDSPQFYFFCDN